MMVLAFVNLLSCIVVFFFFQVEDGIRDWSVTGVQTCALPIPRPPGGDVESGDLARANCGCCRCARAAAPRNRDRGGRAVAITRRHQRDRSDRPRAEYRDRKSVV